MASPFIGSYVNIPAVLYLQEPKRSIYEATPFNPIALPDMPENVKDIPMYLSKMIEDVFQHRYFRIKARNEIKNARSFGKILVNSYFSRESVLRSYGINSEICYLGVDKIKFKRKKGAQRKRNVLTVGSVIPAKNISFIIGSISHMKKPWPILTIVSNYVNDKYYNYIMGMSSRLGVKIEMYRDISDELLIEKYSEATALAYSPRLEPFGYIPLEAGACSLPIVAVAEGGIRETVVNGVNGLLVDGNQEEMAEALSSLINDPKKAAKFGKAGREIVENNWSLDDAVERLEIKLESMM
jgi:glycosyltransferase involved in cell wall biosynthesis